MMLIGFYQIDG